MLVVRVTAVDIFKDTFPSFGSKSKSLTHCSWTVSTIVVNTAGILSQQGTQKQPQTRGGGGLKEFIVQKPFQRGGGEGGE